LKYRKNQTESIDLITKKIITACSNWRVEQKREANRVGFGINNIADENLLRNLKFQIRNYDGKSLSNTNKSFMSKSQIGKHGKNSTSEKKVSEDQDMKNQVELKKQALKNKIDEIEAKDKEFMSARLRFQNLMSIFEKEGENDEADLIRTIADESNKDGKDRKKDFSKVNEVQVKQRVLGFSTRAFDIINLKTLVLWWKGRNYSFR
jgi:hypothetical protein